MIRSFIVVLFDQMNSSANEDIIFDKQMDVNTDSNVWDDEALIRMYDKTTAMAYDKIQKRDKNSKTSTRAGKSANDVSTSKNSGGKVWKVGDTCMAMYDEDEKCYPAKILSVDPSKDKYEVVYTEYNENAVLSYDKLFRDDEVEWTDEDQGLEDGEKASVSVLNNGKQETFPIPDLCPPPPPALFGKIAQAGNNKEALTNMLMSWYMSGYHTGYYQGMQQAKAGNSSTAVTAKRTNANR